MDDCPCFHCRISRLSWNRRLRYFLRGWWLWTWRELL